MNSYPSQIRERALRATLKGLLAVLVCITTAFGDVPEDFEECRGEASSLLGMARLAIHDLEAATRRSYGDFAADALNARCGDDAALRRLRAYADGMTTEDGERVAATAALLHLQEKSLPELLYLAGLVDLPFAFKLALLDSATAMVGQEFVPAELPAKELRKSLAWATSDADVHLRGRALRLIARSGDALAQAEIMPLLLACALQSNAECSDIFDPQTLPTEPFKLAWITANSTQRGWLLRWADPTSQLLDYLVQEYRFANVQDRRSMQPMLASFGPAGHRVLLRSEVQQVLFDPSLLPHLEVDIETDLVGQIHGQAQLELLAEYFDQTVAPLEHIDRAVLVSLTTNDHAWLRLMAAVTLYRLDERTLARPTLDHFRDMNGVLGLGVLAALKAPNIADDSAWMLPLIEMGSARKWRWLSLDGFLVAPKLNAHGRNAVIARIALMPALLAAADIDTQDLGELMEVGEHPRMTAELEMELDASFRMAKHLLRQDRDSAMRLAQLWEQAPQVPWRVLAMMTYDRWGDPRARNLAETLRASTHAKVAEMAQTVLARTGEVQ